LNIIAYAADTKCEISDEKMASRRKKCKSDQYGMANKVDGVDPERHPKIMKNI
jgi:hypothetical protein